MARHKITIECFELDDDPECTVSANMSCSHEANTMPGVSLAYSMHGVGFPRPLLILADAVNELGDLEQTPTDCTMAEAELAFINAARELQVFFHKWDKERGE
jgi:hypothetical protein